jgi:PmbA protein
MVVDGVSHSIEVRGGALEQAERAEGIDIGLRVMLGARQACVSTSDISAEAIELMAQRAVEMARHAPDDAYLRQASADLLAHDWDVEALELFDPTEEPSAAQLQATGA